MYEEDVNGEVERAKENAKPSRKYPRIKAVYSSVFDDADPGTNKGGSLLIMARPRRSLGDQG